MGLPCLVSSLSITNWKIHGVSADSHCVTAQTTISHEVSRKRLSSKTGHEEGAYVGGCSRHAAPWRSRTKQNITVKQSRFVGEKSFTLYVSQMILENKLNFLSAIVHYEL